MTEVMSPLVSQRLWALPVSPAAVKFLGYLVHRSEYGGHLPVHQPQMGEEYGGITKQAVSQLMAPLCDLNIVLRPTRNSYRLHPLAARYESAEAMDTAFRQALADIKANKLPNLRLPLYVTAPPAAEGASPLRAAS
jgi:hypothetical protein